MPETRDLLFEIGTEELPPKSLAGLSRALQSHVEMALERAALAHGAVRSYATPRRLALMVEDLASAQADQSIERRGPALNAAFDSRGLPTKALEGFARSCGVAVDQLVTLDTERGQWTGFRQTVPGASTASLLPDILRQSLDALPIPKRMRWGETLHEFVRPVHWVVLLYGDQVIETEILGLRTGRVTYGHRFHHPAPLRLEQPSEYAERLRREGRVIADFGARKDSIRESAERTAASVNGQATIDPELLDEVASLVEWPVAVLGGFDPGFLQLPPEVLITTMQANQKYFPIGNPRGELLPFFVTFSNLESRAPDTVRQGNERVVRPRLADAQFFWTQDRKRTLESRVPDLAHVTFQKTLGSVLDRTLRIQRLAVEIADRLEVESAWVERAALLAKADLLTEMVGEFPELQGVMGRYYALAEGEPEEIATAIEEHYRPRVSGGILPLTRTGQLLALAEKIDTLAGIFSVGLIPTGDKDPFALRRAALGVIRIIIERHVDLDVRDLLGFALAHLHHDFDRAATHEALDTFLLERLRGYCLEQGHRPDAFEAVLSVRPPRPLDFMARLRAVSEFRRLAAADSLTSANKRIRNLLRRTDEAIVPNVEECQLTEAEERTLFEAARKAKADILPFLHDRDYTAALSRLAQLREVVDPFFDQVMVLCDDPALRANRLALLALVEGLFLEIADISKLQSLN